MSSRGLALLLATPAVFAQYAPPCPYPVATGQPCPVAQGVPVAQPLPCPVAVPPGHPCPYPQPVGHAAPCPVAILPGHPCPYPQPVGHAPCPYPVAPGQPCPVPQGIPVAQPVAPCPVAVPPGHPCPYPQQPMVQQPHGLPVAQPVGFMPMATKCSDTCVTARNGVCEDRGACLWGTDCTDCSARLYPPPPPPPSPSPPPPPSPPPKPWYCNPSEQSNFLTCRRPTFEHAMTPKGCGLFHQFSCYVCCTATPYVPKFSKPVAYLNAPPPPFDATH
eukprot:2236328-Prymnesium_polylepis.2